MLTTRPDWKAVRLYLYGGSGCRVSCCQPASDGSSRAGQQASRHPGSSAAAGLGHGAHARGTRDGQKARGELRAPTSLCR
jgi:hypothetical protein